MIFRQCSAKHPITLYRAPYGLSEIEAIGSTPLGKFCVVSHAKKVYEGDSFASAETTLVSECEKHHVGGQKKHGRFILGKHKMKNHEVINESQA